MATIRKAMRHNHGHSLLFILLLLPLIILAVYAANTKENQALRTQAQNPSPQQTAPTATVVAKSLSIPWAIAFLPDSTMLVTERAGKVKLVSQNGLVEDVGTVSGVLHSGEGGLLGIALHPDFPINNYVYVYYTYAGTGSGTLNRVARFTYNNKQLTAPTTILEAIPGAANHNGGRIKFGPDGFLYITTGDAQVTSNAQDTSSLAGKILRVTDAGLAAPGNPFENRTYSYGHRNPQGLAWNGDTLYATEHGNSSPSCCDEVNLIEAGKNYGWPTIEADAQQANMVTPLANSSKDSTKTWAPSGTAFLNGSIFFGGLKGQALYEAKLQGTSVTGVTEHFKGQFGRIREVIVGPDKQSLYITTSNYDGRGTPKAEDDKIIKVTFTASVSPAPSTAAITPTYGVIAPCPSCNATQAPIVSGGVQPSNIIPSTTVLSQAPEDPCEDETASLAHDKRKHKRHHHHDGDVSQFSEQILRFILELIMLILELFGTGPVNPPTAPNLPGGSSTPMPEDPCAPSAAPQPTTPVGSTPPLGNTTPAASMPPAPTARPQPTINLPTKAPTPTRPVGFTPATIAPQPTTPAQGTDPSLGENAQGQVCVRSTFACKSGTPCCAGKCTVSINTPGDPGRCE